jgi:SAM-dependent methyltransferase
MADHLESQKIPPKEKRGAIAYRKKLAFYLNLIIPATASILEIGCGSGRLLSFINSRRKVGIESSPSQALQARSWNPDAEIHTADACELSLEETFDYIVIADTLNHCSDAQVIMRSAHRFASDSTRVVVTTYNGLWRPVLTFLSWIGLRERHPVLNWLSPGDVRNIAELAGWECIKNSSRILLPVEIPVALAWRHLRFPSSSPRATKLATSRTPSVAHPRSPGISSLFLLRAIRAMTHGHKS